jgi:hypothetical protein
MKKNHPTPSKPQDKKEKQAQEPQNLTKQPNDVPFWDQPESGTRR